MRECTVGSVSDEVSVVYERDTLLSFFLPSFRPSIRHRESPYSSWLVRPGHHLCQALTEKTLKERETMLLNTSSSESFNIIIIIFLGGFACFHPQNSTNLYHMGIRVVGQVSDIL